MCVYTFTECSLALLRMGLSFTKAKNYNGSGAHPIFMLLAHGWQFQSGFLSGFCKRGGKYLKVLHKGGGGQRSYISIDLQGGQIMVEGSLTGHTHFHLRRERVWWVAIHDSVVPHCAVWPNHSEAFCHRLLITQGVAEHCKMGWSCDIPECNNKQWVGAQQQSGVRLQWPLKA